MPKTILIVEDDFDTTLVYAEALMHRGYDVLAARNGAEGVQLAIRHQPRLILMDIRMPIMDGFQAVNYLKSDAVTRSIPVWGISAHFDEEPSIPGGFSRILHKPFLPSELITMVEELLGPA